VTAIPFARRRSSGPKISWAFAALLRAPVALASKALSARPGRDADWRSLDERLLRDVGESPVDGDLARLKARMGASEAGGLDPIACAGLGAASSSRWMKKTCHRIDD
jgi:hypothetical protein